MFQLCLLHRLAVAYANYYYGSWNGQVVADNVTCNGTEYYPFDCEADDPEPGCQYLYGLAAVYCEQGKCG